MRLSGGAPGRVIDNQCIGLNCDGQGNRLGFAPVDTLNRERRDDGMGFQPRGRVLNEGSHAFRRMPMTQLIRDALRNDYPVEKPREEFGVTEQY